MNTNSLVLGGTIKVNRVEPLIENINISSLDIDKKSICTNLEKVLDKNTFIINNSSEVVMDLNNIIINSLNLNNNIIDGIHLKSKQIIDKIHIKSKSIDIRHLCLNIIENKHLKDNIITSRNLVNSSIKGEHIANNTIKLNNIDQNIGYIFNNFILEKGKNRLNINELCITNKNKPLWLININNTNNNLEFLQLTKEGEYIKRQEIKYI